MPYFNIPRDDAALDAFLSRFAAAMGQYQNVLGFEPSDFQACTDASNDYNAKFVASEETKAAATAATRDKKAQTRVSTQVVRSYAARIKSNPAASNQILTAFGFSVTPSGSGPVQIPTALEATPTGQGTAKLKWNRNGNPSNTVFLIEANIDGEWEFFASVTRTSFVDMSATPGVQKSYRVRAQRGSNTSDPSNTATIYLGSGGGSLRIAA